ncbi:ubiquitin-like domain-containing protein [Bacillus sonorensis]|nr:ubiquitin-like domain-containing protein [Bacillus sonorensis]
MPGCWWQGAELHTEQTSSRNNPVSISINGKKQSVRTHAKTVGELMKSLNIKTRKEDHISPAEDTKITSNMNVEYIAAKPSPFGDGRRGKASMDDSGYGRQTFERIESRVGGT